MARILFIGGGSGGHIFPLIAVWRELSAVSPDATAKFVCSLRAEDADYLKEEGLDFMTFDAPKANLLLLFKLPSALRRAHKVLQEIKPDVVFSKGGALSIPLCIVAKRMRIPVVLHESDAIMGRANRIIARLATKTCIGLQSAAHPDEALLTGNPVRPDITSGSREEGIRLTGFTNDTGSKPALLVYGGSQGAQALNDWLGANLDEVLTFANVIHLTGRGKSGSAPRPGYFVREFAHHELPHLYAITNFAVSRAGSGTISELAANGIPACLVPLRGLAQDHQEKNARAAIASGGCLLVEQTEINVKLVSLLRVTVTKLETVLSMKQAMSRLHHPDAAKSIAEIVLHVA